MALHERGPPPCQIDGCDREAHFRNGYVNCLKHDHVDVPIEVREPEPLGIATDEFRYYFGASCGSSRKVLRRCEEPNVMLSYATEKREPWPEVQNLMVDSGGFSLLVNGDGEYPDTVDDYLDYVEESGAEWFVTRDVPTGGDVLEAIDGDVRTAIHRTVELTCETIERHSERGVDAKPMAVLQGKEAHEYVHCYHRLVEEGKLTKRLAVGSLVGRKPTKVVDILTTIRSAIDDDGGEEIELHGLGVDDDVLRYKGAQQALSSADSAAYIMRTRWRANRDELSPRLREEEPRTEWYDMMGDYLDMRDELRELLHPESEKTVERASVSETSQSTLAGVTND